MGVGGGVVDGPGSWRLAGVRPPQLRRDPAPAADVVPSPRPVLLDPSDLASASGFDHGRAIDGLVATWMSGRRLRPGYVDVPLLLYLLSPGFGLHPLAETVVSSTPGLNPLRLVRACEPDGCLLVTPPASATAEAAARWAASIPPWKHHTVPITPRWREATPVTVRVDDVAAAAESWFPDRPDGWQQLLVALDTAYIAAGEPPELLPPVGPWRRATLLVLVDDLAAGVDDDVLSVAAGLIAAGWEGTVSDVLSVAVAAMR